VEEAVLAAVARAVLGHQRDVLVLAVVLLPAVHVLGAACAAPLRARVDALRGVEAEGAVGQQGSALPVVQDPQLAKLVEAALIRARTPVLPALVWLALVHLLDLDDVGIAEVPLLADHVGLADARQEGDRLVVLGEGGRGVVQDRVVVVLLSVPGRESESVKLALPARLDVVPLDVEVLVTVRPETLRALSLTANFPHIFLGVKNSSFCPFSDFHC